MDKFLPDNLMQIESFLGHDPEDVVIALGILFEHGKNHQDIMYVRKGLELAKKLDLKEFMLIQKQAFHFNVANGWSYLQELSNPFDNSNVGDFEMENLEQQIIHLRKALLYSNELGYDVRHSEILTNLGNLFGTIGRFSESLRYYSKALEISPGYPITIANHGNIVFQYARILYDSGQQAYFLKDAHSSFSQALEGEIYEEVKQGIIQMKDNIESILTIEHLTYNYKEKSFSLGDSKEEIDYRKWALEQRLFLNPLNDITKESIASQDFLSLPNLTSMDNKPEFFQILFNQIKQEYCTSRYLYYEGITSSSVHFSDKGNLQLDLSKSINYSLAVEKLKIAFKNCYSILDKIAYFLNDYLELEWNPSSVSFRRIWYTNKKGSGKKVLDKINATENWAFRGLYWLNKDFYESKISFASSIAPESKEMAKIRNYMEHKSINVVSDDTNIIEADDGKCYWISRKELEERSLVLFQTVRAAVIYLSLGINVQEYKKEVLGPVIPIDPVLVDDNLKN